MRNLIKISLLIIFLSVQIFALNVGKIGTELIKEFEGLELHSYKCSAGVWTIGYGHTRTASKNQSITKQQASWLLEEDLQRFEEYVKDLRWSYAQYEFDALVSLAFNVGSFGKNLSRSVRLGLPNTTYWIRKYNKAGGVVLRGLVRRRESEAKVYDGDLQEIRKYDPKYCKKEKSNFNYF